MHVKGLIWLGLRTAQFEEMVKFFAPDGTVFEILSRTDEEK